MAEIVNLRMARKAQRRAKKAMHATENRAKFGQTRAEREVHKREKLRDENALDNARLERD